ncbi:uncharacterized protein JN550_008600 [Neoarthrinium moseri]|uniref:uncharacterized protein n=1 Tax=Neoarthrinium moseri TaxID=1658444 RepID=UPI001FDC269D|nr:uncharacterized protein JN550_008600 [Neoarthrinium moseri]KAI1865054.1 hypothetical protein JN550_008600 [Neoarthrinium moseri]
MQSRASTSSWEAKKADIDDFLTKSFSSKQSRAAYITAPHASGKSTTLLLHVYDMAKKAKVWPVVYVLPRYEEARDLYTYLTVNQTDLPNAADICEYTTLAATAEDMENSVGEKVIILCAYEMFGIWNTPYGRMVVMADVELRATVDGEIFFGKLVEMARPRARDSEAEGEQPDKHPLSIICLGARTSFRTVNHFNRWLGGVSIIEAAPSAASNVNVTRLGNDWAEQMSKALADWAASSDKAAGTAVATLGPSIDELEINHEAVDPQVVQHKSLLYGSDNQGRPFPFARAVRRSGLVILDPDHAVSASCANLEMFLSGGVTKSTLFDLKTSQLVVKDRYLSHYELLLEESWVLKCRNPERVKFLRRVQTSGHVSRQQQGKPADPIGPAWNEDLFVLALRMAELWPGVAVRRMPIRGIFNPNILPEVWVRLTKCGLLLPGNGQPGVRISNRGSTALECIDLLNEYKDLPRSAEVNIHIACFMAGALETEDSKVQRVILLLSAIMHLGCEEFCRVMRQVVLSEVTAYTAGVGRTNASRGMLWIVLGVFLDLYNHQVFAGGAASYVRKGDLLLIDPQSGIIILDLYKNWCRRFGVPAQELDLINATDLDSTQIRAVEWQLLLAFQHRTVFIDADTGRCCDVVSQQAVKLAHHYMIDLQSLRQNDTEGLGFAMIYDSLRYQRLTSEYFVRGITNIPRELIVRLARHHGVEWPTCVLTSFPRA